MSIAADTRYRNVSVSFLNNDQDGSELVQLLARPSGGNWSVQRTFPVALTGDQEEAWATALPLTLYDVALRYMIGQTAAVGYESSDPDVWTSPHAAGSKGTVTTGCAAATGLDGTYTGAVLRLTWACAQQNVPFLVEKSADGVSGWTSVVSDLVATAYDYTPAGGELNTTVYFRVTPKRGSVAGVVGGAVAIYVGIQVGQPTITSATFSDETAKVSLAWSAASSALQYIIEKDTGGGWTTVATVSTLTYDYSILSAEVNTTIDFRVTGKNGSVLGTPSTTASVPCPMVIGVPTLAALVKGPSGIGPSVTWSVTSNPFTPASGPVVSHQVEWSESGVPVLTQSVSATASFLSYTTALSYPSVHGVTVSVRARGVGAGPIYGAWTTPITIVV